jgi:hypothetical protein
MRKETTMLNDVASLNIFLNTFSCSFPKRSGQGKESRPFLVSHNQLEELTILEILISGKILP